MIIHITGKQEWQEAIRNGLYLPLNYDKDGFIHCSPIERITGVANYNYKAKKNLVLLFIDETKLKSKVVWEDLYNSDVEFPHIYGSLNIDAVVKVVDFPCGEDGFFTLPNNI